MPEKEIVLNLKGQNRKEIRNNLILEFLKEAPGTDGETSRYFYYVEKTKENIDIYLKRPARLNKGMDFEVHAEDFLFTNVSDSGRVSRATRPSHSAILNDLRIKKKESPSQYKSVQLLIERLYNCNSIEQKEYINIGFKKGYHIELVLKIIKWLFIEQDVTYWNWSGRQMFYSKLKEI
jgi:hypothetical protein